KELALQITDVFKQISHHAKLRIRSLVTSKNLKQQGFEVLVTTPSKLSVALKKKELSFRDLRYLVFDEADQLFDMGFKRDIEGIIKFVEFDEVDIHFFSATMPVDVETFLKEKFRKKNLEMIQLGSAHKTQQRIETFNLFIQPEEKLAALEAFIKRTAQGRGIVFVNQKNQVEEVNKFLLERLPTLKFKILHGDLPEKLRISNIKSFMQKKSHILVASDVAARGMDIKDLDWVLNFGLPKSPIYYLHRCGRTGRAGREGRVYNFVTSFDSKLISQINQSIREQSHMDIGLISDKTTKKKTSKKVQRPKKTKRLKVTKRTRH
ncbi:MAG: DEAD/DEAH box helicase, partial [Bdellovibrionota bacterium]|nr:DEAD/DEAH box helicase [Bdellovibrionota bacterium]